MPVPLVRQHRTRNGAGKTTTVRILSTLSRPDAGRARVVGFDVVAELADLIAVPDGGRLVAEGTAAELKRRVASQRLDLRLGDAAAFDKLAGHLDGHALHVDRATLTIGVPTDGAAASVRALLDSLDPDRHLIADFAVHGASLDDVFLALTGGD